MQYEKYAKTWVDSIIIWVRPYWEVRDSICNPSGYDSSYPHYLFHLGGDYMIPVGRNEILSRLAGIPAVL